MGERTDEVTPSPATDETIAIRAEIESTRADMSETIDALQEKLAPERVAEQVKEKVREQAAEAYTSARATVKSKAERIVGNMSSTIKEAGSTAGTFASNVGSSLMDTRGAQAVRQNPIPFALIGAGLTMLLVNRRRQSQRPYYLDRVEPYSGSYRNQTETYGSTAAYDSAESYGSSEGGLGGSSMTDRTAGGASQTASRASDAASSAARTLADNASAARNRTREALSTATQRTRQTTARAGDALESAVRQNPLAVGVAAIAVGSVVGLALPVTRTEQQYMGETRDQLVDKASNAARDTVQKVQRAAEEAGRTVQQQLSS